MRDCKTGRMADERMGETELMEALKLYIEAFTVGGEYRGNPKYLKDYKSVIAETDRLKPAIFRAAANYR
ncbi:MAG: hypothetical protein NTY20_05750 [Candidatus Aenigmarchaeota archaeon]|nr:hypothetical protein [Candidatus Aenigmarchaeota archaeon]